MQGACAVFENKYSDKCILLGPLTIEYSALGIRIHCHTPFSINLAALHFKSTLSRDFFTWKAFKVFHLNFDFQIRNDISLYCTPTVL